MSQFSSQSDLYVKSAQQADLPANWNEQVPMPLGESKQTPLSWFGACNQLFKLRITVMVGVMTAIGVFLNFETFKFTQHGLLLTITMLGAMLSCMGASAFNQILEIEVDKKMARTCMRPLASGAWTKSMAAIFAWVLSLLGVSLLLFFVNWQSAFVSALTIFSYALIYTPMKRKTHLATIVGAVPGAFPPVIGYLAVNPQLDLRISLIFAIMFLWQLPHFLAIAWLYRDDYAKAEIPVLPVVDPTGLSTFTQMLLGCFALLPLGLLPTVLGMAGALYFLGALTVGMMFLMSTIWLMMNPSESAARIAFYVSLIYLPVVFFLFVIDKI